MRLRAIMALTAVHSGEELLDVLRAEELANGL